MSEKDKAITQLTFDEVLQILNLIEKLDYDFLQLEAGDFKLSIGKRGFHIDDDGGPQTGTVAPAASSRQQVRATTSAARTTVQQPRAETKAPAVKEGTVPIVAPMVGTFYTAPEPGAPPFIKAGDSVDANTTVGLIEVMKVFNAVSSKATGVILEICVQNGQFVEYGQTLFLVKPETN